MAIKDDKEQYRKYIKEYQIKRYYDRKAFAIKILGGKCHKCGSSKKLEVSNSLGGFNAIWHRSKKVFEEALKISILLCGKCHSKKQIIAAGKKVAKGNHGTISSYRYCKCDLCLEAKRENNKKYSKNRKRKSRKRVYKARVRKSECLNTKRFVPILFSEDAIPIKVLPIKALKFKNKMPAAKKINITKKAAPIRKKKLIGKSIKKTTKKPKEFNIGTAKTIGGRKISDATRYHTKMLLRLREKRSKEDSKEDI